MTGLKWTRKTTEKISVELKGMGISVCAKTVGRLLKELDFRLRANEKKITRCRPVERDAQFQNIAALRESFTSRGLPIISVDTKKKELVGLFKNAGSEWARKARPVLDHDFRSDAKGIAVPYGIYLPTPNVGMVFVGTSHDTPEFAVDCIEAWWKLDGRQRYPAADSLLILADSGGSNGASPRAWKYFLKHRLCNVHRLSITVAHYPSGASKWNPIEHRLFSEISKNWAAQPLETWETVLKFIATTRTATGLSVGSALLNKEYTKGLRIKDAQMRELGVEPGSTLPKWNYTLRPS